MSQQRPDHINARLGDIEDEGAARELEAYIEYLETLYERMTPEGAILTMLTRAGWLRLRVERDAGNLKVFGRYPERREHYGGVSKTEYGDEEVVYNRAAWARTSA